MKYKTNIPALLLTVLFFAASNGVAFFEHICNTSKTHDYSFFQKPACEMEKPIAACCAKKGLTKKKDCCEHKQIFSKLSVEGFTAKQIKLKPAEKNFTAEIWNTITCNYKPQILESHYSGLSPPDNLYQIKSLLQPSTIKLQTFRC